MDRLPPAKSGLPSRASSVVAVLVAVSISTGCGGQVGHPKAAALSRSKGMSLPYRVETRTTAGGKTETIYVHEGPVSPANTKHIITAKLANYGTVLVTGEHRALYVHVPDGGGSAVSPCTGQCATVWPPMRLTIEMTVDASPVLEVPLVSTEPDPENHRVGDRVVKFAEKVLHTYTGDTGPLMARGQGVASYGGRWYLLSPSGHPVTGVTDQPRSRRAPS